ncbi:MAG: potassium channel protein [bacterium]|nr:potassium channel protein [bacterium]
MLNSELNLNSVRKGLGLMVLVIALGVLWFMAMEGFSFMDALYMTIITVSTVGFNEVHVLDISGRIFVLVLIVTGLTVMTYTLGAVGKVIIEGSIQHYLGRQRMNREVENLKNHYMVCGHGRMGNILCEELQREGVDFVVIEQDPDKAQKLIEKGYLVVKGNATEDHVLETAGVRRAKGLVAVVSNNVNNLYITLSAREMSRQENPYLYILSRATDQSASEKITRAGANRVISPYAIGGMRIVQALLRPTVYDFVEVATQSSGLELMFEEFIVGMDSILNEIAIKDSNIRSDFDVIVIGIKKPNGQMIFNPGPNVTIHTGDELIVLGDRDQLKRLEKIVL